MWKKVGKTLVNAWNKVVRAKSSRRGRAAHLQRCPTVSVGTYREFPVGPRMTRSFSCPSTSRATLPRAIVSHTTTGMEPYQDDDTIRFASDASEAKDLDHLWIISTIATDPRVNVLFGRLQAFREGPLPTGMFFGPNDVKSIRTFEAEFKGVRGSATAACDEVDLSSFTKIQFVTDNQDVAIHLGQRHIFPLYQYGGMEPLISSTKVVLGELLGHREVEVCWVFRDENPLADAFAKIPRKALQRRQAHDKDDVAMLIEELMVGKFYPSHMIEDLRTDLGIVAEPKKKSI